MMEVVVVHKNGDTVRGLLTGTITGGIYVAQEGQLPEPVMFHKILSISFLP